MKIKKLNKAIFLSLGAALLLSACGTSEVIKNPTANGYVVSAQYGALNGSWTRATQEAADKAKAYCAESGRQFVFITEQRTGVVGWSPQESSIAFDCVDANTKPASSISF
jgi:putative hemolysin